MGMFDSLLYENEVYQTKDTPHQTLDLYKIEDDKLWHEAYKAKWVEDAGTISGYRLETWDHHWKHCDDFDGLIRFYRQDKEHDAWIEFNALFMDGKVLKLEKLNEEV